VVVVAAHTIQVLAEMETHLLLDHMLLRKEATVLIDKINIQVV
jgi:hypothetical protein